MNWHVIADTLSHAEGAADTGHCFSATHWEKTYTGVRCMIYLIRKRNANKK